MRSWSHSSLIVACASVLLDARGDFPSRRSRVRSPSFASTQGPTGPVTNRQKACSSGGSNHGSRLLASDTGRREPTRFLGQWSHNWSHNGALA